MSTKAQAIRRPRKLVHLLVESLGERIRDGRLAPGVQLPTEAALMDEFQVSRTVVREAMSRLQAAGLTDTRHGVGSFVAAAPANAAFSVQPHEMRSVQEVVALLELRIGVESEAASLAAQRRTAADLRALRDALAAFEQALEAGSDAVAADFQFHCALARASHNTHFADLLVSLGAQVIPRARLDPASAADPARQAFLRRVHAEHQSIYDAVQAQDPDGARAAMRTHLVNSRERRRRVLGEAVAPLQPLKPVATGSRRRPAARLT